MGLFKFFARCNACSVRLQSTNPVNLKKQMDGHTETWNKLGETDHQCEVVDILGRE